MISNHGLFSFYENPRGAANGQDFRGVFEGFTELWTTACWVARQLNHLKGLYRHGLRYYNFPYFCMTWP